jgi:disulfide bond formation protein DsbB
MALKYSVSENECTHFKLFIESINGARRVRFSPHDSGTVKVIGSILVLSSAHDCAHASVSGHLNTGWTLCEQRAELSRSAMKWRKVGEKTFCVAVSCGENCTLLALFAFSIKCLKWVHSFSDTLYYFGYSLVRRSAITAAVHLPADSTGLSDKSAHERSKSVFALI